MTDLDGEIRATFQSPPGFVAGPIDLDQIMKSGTRMRRRRAAVRGATVIAVLGVFVGSLQTTGVLDRSDRDTVPAVTITTSPTPPSPTIITGLKAGADSTWVITTTSVDIFDSKKKTFGFAINERSKTGELTEDNVISEVNEGSEMAPGFHATEHAYTYTDVEFSVQPAYGYFVGSPAKIVGTVDGQSVTAQMQVSSVDPSVVVFWFDNTKVTGDTHLTTVTAYDQAGAELASAHVSTEGEDGG